mmetsp:Transcript_2519/g.3707  ORF Transcript_2519/g.3707 Transcript_2519/m.3707 type:complete len:361 (-) Transcript_2519:172-1254(-)|eukprot:CAMPEP_0171452994 /NCGR_PEP_ID=MMETSP0945-20130129/882_1 /TAXON_ID=109269 /ORGANISM="Vaucheria litorea, Strain CCMP2940" /LENGTH=360 /DNA_ID=CAMNT_0011977777 /DNA_START=196 /DNA_END=1278 /DNA_ORIENTATION=+
MGCSNSKKTNASVKTNKTQFNELPQQPPAPQSTTSLEKRVQLIGGKYKLIGDLGSGNYSVVKLGLDVTNNQEVAIKCTKRIALSQDDEEAHFTEVKILGTLNHPNIVKMHAFYEENTHYYMVMEVLKGGELFDRIVKKQFYSEKQARDVLMVLLEAVKYIHDRNIAHRDLKPENLLLVSKDDDALLKVADFGFARIVDENKLASQCGTPGYVAPEILTGVSYGIEVDIWSVGVIMYILLGGYPPFHDENKTQLFKKIKKGIVVFHSQYWDHVSFDAKDLISRMLTLDVSRRITAAQALEHPWMKDDDMSLASHDLSMNLVKLQSFNARRKFRSAIATIMLTNQLQKIIEESSTEEATPEL